MYVNNRSSPVSEVMVKMLKLVTFVALSTTLCWAEVPWSFQTYLGQEYTLICNDTDIMLMEEETVVWKTPSTGDKILDSSTDDFTIEMSGQRLTVKDVQESRHGIYVCIIHHNNGTERMKALRAINLYDHLYHDQFDKYRHNLIVAVIATAVFLVPALTLCFLYKCRYMTDDQRRIKHQKREAYINRAYHHDVNGVPEKTGIPSESVAYEEPDKMDLSTQL